MAKIVICFLIFSSMPNLFAQAVPTLAGNPGNIFLAGQSVTVPIPTCSTGEWQAVDYDGKVIAKGDCGSGSAQLGALPVGYYSIRDRAGMLITTAGVLQPLAAQTPQDSPIGVDTSAAWFYKTEEQWTAVANLAAIAGMNWVRDRYSWQGMEPQPGVFATQFRYDTVTDIFHQAGLHTLQVSADAAPWVHATPKRFPNDLRDVFNFYKGIAARWRGKVQAIEPWNEPDHDNSGAEMASFQKAAYLGMKAGNSDMLVCSAPWALAPFSVSNEFTANETADYFDTFNIHFYLQPDHVADLFKTLRASAKGKPLWVSEFNLPVQWSGAPEWKDPDEKSLSVQAQRVAQLFAATLYQRPQVAFFFVLGNYAEGRDQFGLLRQDLTPRPGYLALAAVGRLLAEAKAIGQVVGASGTFTGSATVYGFSAMPDGQQRDVLVAWADHGQSTLALPMAPIGLYDLIGRPVPFRTNPQSVQLSGSPVFVVLPSGTVSSWANSRGRSLSVADSGSSEENSSRPSPVVLQAVFSPEQLIKTMQPKITDRPISSSVQRIGSGSPQAINLFAYNFSSKAQNISLKVDAPIGWKYTLPTTTFNLPANSRVPVQFDITPATNGSGQPGTVTIHAEGEGIPSGILVFQLSQ